MLSLSGFRGVPLLCVPVGCDRNPWGVRIGPDEFGSPYPLLEVETDDGEVVAVHAFHTVLKNELAKKRPDVGDRVGIKYLGTPPGKNYESYRVVIERTTASSPNWDAIGANAAEEMAAAGAEPAPAFEPF
jgi:hypothetical protein